MNNDSMHTDIMFEYRLHIHTCIKLEFIQIHVSVQNTYTYMYECRLHAHTCTSADYIKIHV